MAVVDNKDKIVVRSDVLPVDMPCCLCGFKVPHRLVLPSRVAKELFRSTTNADGVWVPVKHTQAGLCPDPPAWTKAFWGNETMRENYKAEHRAAHARAMAATNGSTTR